jgi:glycosyltransferase involved in cell wall biosynthesis
MRILMLAESFAPIVGGVERIVESLSTALAGRGHEVSVATLRQPDSESPSFDGVEVHELGSTAYRIPRIGSDRERHHAPPLPDPETVVDLRRVLRRTRPEVVHAHNWIVHSYLPLDRRSGAALVLSMHDYGLVCATKRFLNKGALCTGPGPAKCVSCAADYYGALKGPPIAACTRLSERRIRRHVDVFLPVSRTVGNLCGVEGPNVSVVPNFLAGLPPSRPEDEPLLAGVPDEPFIFYFGDVTVDKGAYHLVSVYGELDSPPPLVLVGRNYLDLEGIPGVIALGRMPHHAAIEVLRRSMFTVAPSILPETFGLVALESAAASKPIVASATGGLGEVVIDGETGILVTPGDGKALRAALERMIGDEPLRARMGSAAKQRAAAFSPEAVVPQFEAAYDMAIDGRRARQRSGRQSTASG